MTFAADLFRHQDEFERLSDDFTGRVTEWLGRTLQAAGWNDCRFDPYDGSFELYGCDPDLRMPAESLPAIWEAGFERFWLNHTDGYETCYAKGWPESRKEPLK